MGVAFNKNKCRVKFSPDNVEVMVEKGSSLLSAALAAGVHINASCGGTGVCGTCKVKIESGAFDRKPSNKLTKEEGQKGLRQACQTTV
jgi:ferredoxin